MTVVVTPGGVRPVYEEKNWPFQGLEPTYRREYGIESDLEFVTPGMGAGTYLDMYKTQPWIYTVVTKLSRGVARLPLKSYAIDLQSGNRIRVREELLPRLIARPNPRGTLSGLIEATAANVALYGNALWVKERPRASRAPDELWLVPWPAITINGGGSQPIESYELRGSSGTRTLLPSDCVHFHFFAPSGTIGISPLQPLARTLQLEDAAQRSQTSFYRNMMRPPGGFIASTLKDKDYKLLRNEIDQTYGGVENAGRPLLLTGELDYKTFAHTAQESELIEQRLLTREEVCAVYDVPPPMVGILNHATYSNIDTQHKMMYQDTLGPWLTMMEETIQVQLIDDEPEFSGTFCEFDLSEVLKGNVGERFNALGTAVGGPWMTPNEARRIENLPPVNDRGADSIHSPMNMVSLDGRIPSPDGSPVGQPALGSDGNAA